MSSYVNSTDAGDWDQMIVLSQKTINESFENMWNVAQFDDDTNPLKYYNRETREGSIKFQVGIPSVELQTTTNDPLLYFMLKMTTGSCFIYLSEDVDDDSHIEWDINEWVFAFSVAIGQKKIDQQSQEYKDFKDRAGLPNWDFSLVCLFLDASSTTKFSPDLSNFGDKQQDFNNLTSDAKATFLGFINGWLNKMSVDGCNILGYSAQANKNTSDQYQPTFPPTEIDYGTYPWRATPTSANQNNNDQNALCYLMMSNFKNPAVYAAPYTGQWVDDKHDATYVLNRSLYWPWMFSVLRDVVKSMVPVPDAPTLYWDNTDPKHPYAARMEYHFGDNAATGNDYPFVSAGPGQWAWTGRSITSFAQANNPKDSGDYEIVTESVNVDPGTRNGKLTFSPGQEQITLAGMSTFGLRVDHSTNKHYTKMTFTLTWSMTISMAAVEDGGLVFKFGDQTVDTQSTSEGNLSWSVTPEALAAEFKSQMSNSLHNAAETAKANLMDALANQHRLFLPGKGNFLMKDPVFNSKGDLLVGLTFNGADPPTKPPPATKPATN